MENDGWTGVLVEQITYLFVTIAGSDERHFWICKKIDKTQNSSQSSELVAYTFVTHL